MLATLADKPFDDPEWIFEVKWDGYRAIAEVRGGKVRLYSRNLLSYETRFSPIAASLAKLARDALIDGEIVMLDAGGKPNFQWLQVNQRGNRGQLA